MKAARTFLLAAALAAVAISGLSRPGAAHSRPEIAPTALSPMAAQRDGACQEPRGVSVAVAGLPTTIKIAGAFEQKGVSCALAGDLRPAIAHFGEAIRRFPWRPQSYANRGQAFAGLGEYEFAILDYDEAIRLAPDQETYATCAPSRWRRSAGPSRRSTIWRRC